MSLASLDDHALGDARWGADTSELAAFASRHEDAHLVKYTLACLHAAQDDPGWRDGYLIAAAYLADWWRANG